MSDNIQHNNVGFLTLKDIIDIKNNNKNVNIIKIPDDDNKELEEYFQYSEDNNPVAKYNTTYKEVEF